MVPVASCVRVWSMCSPTSVSYTHLGSAIEVLLFAISRQMVVEHTSAVETLLGIIAIALIFIIRKFWFVPSFGAHHPDNGEESYLEDYQEPAESH